MPNLLTELGLFVYSYNDIYSSTGVAGSGSIGYDVKTYLRLSIIQSATCIDYSGTLLSVKLLINSKTLS